MSYSMAVGPTPKEDVSAAVTEIVDKMIESQPFHAIERDAIIANAVAAADKFNDGTNLKVVVTGHGYKVNDNLKELAIAVHVLAVV